MLPLWKWGSKTLATMVPWFAREFEGMMPIVTKKFNVDRWTGLMVEGWPTPSCSPLFLT